MKKRERGEEVEGSEWKKKNGERFDANAGSASLEGGSKEVPSAVIIPEYFYAFTSRKMYTYQGSIRFTSSFSINRPPARTASREKRRINGSARPADRPRHSLSCRTRLYRETLCL